MLRADDDACIRQLEKGMRHNPDAWELPYEIALTYLLNRPDRPDSPIEAARYLTMAIKTGEAPPHVLALAESLQRGHADPAESSPTSYQTAPPRRRILTQAA